MESISSKQWNQLGYLDASNRNKHKLHWPGKEFVKRMIGTLGNPTWSCASRSKAQHDGQVRKQLPLSWALDFEALILVAAACLQSYHPQKGPPLSLLPFDSDSDQCTPDWESLGHQFPPWCKRGQKTSIFSHSLVRCGLRF